MADPLAVLAELDRASRDFVAEEGPWEKPVPFYQGGLPAFPTQALPAWLRAFVEAEAEATQTPVDMPAMVALGVLAVALQKKVVVRVRPGWAEPVNIFTAVVLPPANRKSQVFRDAAEPLEDWEAKEAEWVKPQIAEAATAYEIAKSRLSRLQTEAAKAKEPGIREELSKQAADAAWELAAMKVPAVPRLVADDATPEKLSNLLFEQGGKMAVMSPEGDVFDIMAGRYSATGSPNFGVYLKGHAGDTLRVDRIGRPPEHVRNPALTAAFTIQPSVILGLFEIASFRGRGLLARFLYALPESLVGRRKVSPDPVPEPVRAAYSAQVHALLSLTAAKGEDGAETAHILNLTPEALVRFETFMARLEPDLAPGGELGTLDDWAGKLAGAVARIAGLLHGADAAATPPWERPIEETTIKRAVAVGEYLIPHARAAYAEMGADPAVEHARYLLAWIKKAGVQRFAKQELWQATKGKVKRTEELDKALELLVEHLCLRAHEPEREPGTRGRKPAPTYEVNPHLASYNSYNPYNSMAEANSRDIRNSRTPGGGSEPEDQDAPPWDRSSG